MSDQPALNTDRELFREDTGEPAGSYYENSVHVTIDQKIGMNVSGRVIVLPISEWHALAWPDARPEYDTPADREQHLDELAAEARAATTTAAAFHIAIRAAHMVRLDDPAIDSFYAGAVKAERTIARVSGVHLGDYPERRDPLATDPPAPTAWEKLDLDDGREYIDRGGR